MDSASISKTSVVRDWQELERRPRFLVWANERTGKGFKDIVQQGLQVMGCEYQMGRERSKDWKDLPNTKENQ